MKALTASFSLGREMWDRVKSRFLGKTDGAHSLLFNIVEIPEPSIPNSNWVRIRTVLSGISDFDEAIAVDQDVASLGAFGNIPIRARQREPGLNC